MYNDKEARYRNLVLKRKSCHECEHLGMKNPSTIVTNGRCLDCEEIDAWALWQNSLDADILLIGQEWGDVNGYMKDTEHFNGIYSDTNRNLIELFKTIGIDVKDPYLNEKNKRLFFTNAALCLKENGGAQGETSKIWYSKCGKFIKELIDIIEPKVVITLGFRAYDAMVGTFNLKVPGYSKFSEVINRNLDGIKVKTTAEGRDIVLFPVYHPARRIINLGNKYEGKKYRSWNQMLDDWKRIERYLSGKAIIEECAPILATTRSPMK